MGEILIKMFSLRPIGTAWLVMPSKQNILELLLDFPPGTHNLVQCATHLIKSILQDSGYLIPGVRWEVQKPWPTFLSSLKPWQNSVCEIQGISNACGDK